MIRDIYLIFNLLIGHFKLNAGDDFLTIRTLFCFRIFESHTIFPNRLKSLERKKIKDKLMELNKIATKKQLLFIFYIE